MENNITVVENVHGYTDVNGTVWLNVEDVARGLGFTQRQIKNGKEYTSLRMETVNRYLAEFGFPSEVGKDDYIPENMFYRLAMKANNAAAQVFQAKVADEILPSIRRNGFYAVQPLTPAEMLLQTAQVMVDLEREQKRQAVVQEQQQKQLDRHEEDISIVKKRVDASDRTSALLQGVNEQQQQQLDKQGAAIADLQRAFDDKGPREEVKILISDIVRETANTAKPYSYQEAYRLFYDYCWRAGHVNLALRLKNLKQRRRAEGWSTAKISKVTVLDAIDTDPAVWQTVRNVIEILYGFLRNTSEKEN